MRNGMGPRSDQRHVSAQNVVKLRQLIHAGLPEESSKPGDRLSDLRAWTISWPSSITVMVRNL
jgi:hypothetical protein